jgi:hypothetical protein
MAEARKMAKDAIIAAIPNLITSNVTANEASAMACLKLLVSQEAAWRMTDTILPQKGTVDFRQETHLNFRNRLSARPVGRVSLRTRSPATGGTGTPRRALCKNPGGVNSVKWKLSGLLFGCL